ncbi:Aminoacyl-tRNA synthetase, class II (D/K/N) [Dillenia turbinata]|uniref:Aminoacyl-tRNA synthetase, class II (D/K/N) n=1 Tax=Dillenia turbinata TaxID=194707 RepID=A0AAN8WC63_9MAGN
MLMVSGFDKYYQIARCFRDEDLRADRQPEFTQLDMELAFTPLEVMLRLNEDLIRQNLGSVAARMASWLITGHTRHVTAVSRLVAVMGFQGCHAPPNVFGHDTSVNRTLDRLRVFIANDLGLIDHSAHSILWVTDFPMFEWNSSEERLEALHHPFTAPNPEDMGDLSTARALAYDMVYNGVEIGGGSLRIYKREVQEKVLEIVGISPKQVLEIVGISPKPFVPIPNLNWKLTWASHMGRKGISAS